MSDHRVIGMVQVRPSVLHCQFRACDGCS
jgi:hypothetical protein